MFCFDNVANNVLLLCTLKFGFLVYSVRAVRSRFTIYSTVSVMVDSGERRTTLNNMSSLPTVDVRNCLFLTCVVIVVVAIVVVGVTRR